MSATDKGTSTSPQSLPHPSLSTAAANLGRQSMPFLFPRKTRPLSVSATDSADTPQSASPHRQAAKPWPKLPHEASNSSASSPSSVIFRRPRQQSESAGSRRSFFGPGGRLRPRSPSITQEPYPRQDVANGIVLIHNKQADLSGGFQDSSRSVTRDSDTEDDPRLSLSTGSLPQHRVRRKTPPKMVRSNTGDRMANGKIASSSSPADVNIQRRASNPYSDGTSHKLVTVGSPPSGYPSSVHGSSSSGGIYSSDSASFTSSHSNLAHDSSAGESKTQELDAHTLALELHGLVKQLELRNSPSPVSPSRRRSPRKVARGDIVYETPPRGDLSPRHHSRSQSEQPLSGRAPARASGHSALSRNTTPKNHSGIPPEPTFGDPSAYPEPAVGKLAEGSRMTHLHSAREKEDTPELSLTERSRLLRQLFCLPSGPGGLAGDDTTSHASVDWGSLGVPTELASRVSLAPPADISALSGTDQYRRGSDPSVPIGGADSALSGGDFYTPVPSPPVSSVDASGISASPHWEAGRQQGDDGIYARLASVRLDGRNHAYEASDATTSSRSRGFGTDLGSHESSSEDAGSIRPARSGARSRGASMSMLSEDQSVFDHSLGSSTRAATDTNLRLASHALDAYQSALRVLFGLVHENALTPRELDSLLTATSARAFEESTSGGRSARSEDVGRLVSSVAKLDSQLESTLGRSPDIGADLGARTRSHAAWVANASLLGPAMDDEALDRIDGWRAQVEPSRAANASGRSRSHTTPLASSPTHSPLSSISQPIPPTPSGLVGAASPQLPGAFTEGAQPLAYPACHTPRAARSIEGSPSLKASPRRQRAEGDDQARRDAMHHDTKDPERRSIIARELHAVV